MPDIIFRIAAVVCTSMLLLRGAAKGSIHKNSICIMAAVLALMAGAILFKSSVMIVWAVLVVQSYTDITEQHVFTVLTYAMIGMEIGYILIGRIYPDISPHTLIFPFLLIKIISLCAYADGDKDLFLLVMLDAYSHRVSPDIFIVYFMLIACVMFVLYMTVDNVIRKLKRMDAVRKGAFVPAMAAAYFILALLKF